METFRFTENANRTLPWILMKPVQLKSAMTRYALKA